MLFISDNNPEELEEVAMLNPMIKSALEAEIVFSASEQNRYIYDLKENARMDFLSAIDTAKEDGKVEGKLEVARDMLLDGLDVQYVSRMTHIPFEQIQQLKNSL